MSQTLLVGGFTLGGVALGFFGQWILEQRRSRKVERTVVTAITLELAMLSAALREAVLNRNRTREALRRDYWDRFGPEAVNYLPGHVIKLLHLQFIDTFDIVRNAYARAAKGTTPEEERAVGACLLGWAYRAQSLVDHIQTTYSQIPWWRRLGIIGSDASAADPKGEKFRQVLDELEEFAATKVQEDGYPVNGEARWSDGAERASIRKFQER